ncbi:MAG: 6-phosphogluconolactonase [Actinomycetota bacterium]|nr:6-phosphogluconolactonase [Actinomycetota bacterium]
MTQLGVEVFPTASYAADAAEAIARALPGEGSLVLTGGTTAARIYSHLAQVAPAHIAKLEVLFSDERSVPPEHEESNFKMANDLLLQPRGIRTVHRMRGEDPPAKAAAAYGRSIAPVVQRGLDLVLLGMGADAHIGAMFPGSPALHESQQLCAAVDRPDGMQGLTLTPPAMRSGRKVLLLVAGEGKAATVRRVIHGDEPVERCPARLLADHSDATFLLDEAAASAL